MVARQGSEPHGPGAIEFLPEARREPSCLEFPFGGFGVAVAGHAVIREVDAVAAAFNWPDGDAVGCSDRTSSGGPCRTGLFIASVSGRPRVASRSSLGLPLRMTGRDRLARRPVADPNHGATRGSASGVVRASRRITSGPDELAVTLMTSLRSTGVSGSRICGFTCMISMNSCVASSSDHGTGAAACR